MLEPKSYGPRSSWNNQEYAWSISLRWMLWALPRPLWTSVSPPWALTFDRSKKLHQNVARAPSRLLSFPCSFCPWAFNPDKFYRPWREEQQASVHLSRPIQVTGERSFLVWCSRKPLSPSPITTKHRHKQPEQKLQLHEWALLSGLKWALNRGAAHRAPREATCFGSGVRPAQLCGWRSSPAPEITGHAPEFLTSEEAGGGHPSDTGRWGASQKLVFQGTEHAIWNQPFEACPGCLVL